MKLHVVFQVIFGHGQDWSDPARLDEELAYLTEITLPSLAAQSDGNFRLLILCDDGLDDDTRNRIRHAVWALLPRRRAKVIFRGGEDAGAELTRSTNGRFDDRPWRVQVALDHDAAVSNDYVARLRAAAGTRIKRLSSTEDYLFMAFGAHYGLSLDHRGDAALYEKPARRGDSGLALLAAHGHEMSPFAHRGQPISPDHPIDLLGGTKPFVLGLLTDRSIRVAKRVTRAGEDKVLADAARRFSWLGPALNALPQRTLH